MKGIPMKIKSFSQATCAALVLTLLCTAVPASAQMRSHGTPGCGPGNPHCQNAPTERGRSGRGNAGGNDGSNGWRNGERDMGHNRNGRMARQPMPAPMPMPMPPHGGMIERQGWPDQRPDPRYVQPHDQGRRPWADRGLHRGDRVPQDERAKQYVVDDWQGHGLRRPPRGYHWVQNGGDYLLVAITTGIILELLLSR